VRFIKIWGASLRHPRKDKKQHELSSPAKGESSQAATANVFEKQAFGFVIPDNNETPYHNHAYKNEKAIDKKQRMFYTEKQRLGQ
jgi:hypothetical protein